MNLVDRLDKATDKVVEMAIKNCEPLSVSKKSTLIGNVSIEKNDTGYDIVALNKNRLYKNISLFDIAVTIAQKYNNGEVSSIRKILVLEDKYSKHHVDMIHYLNCLKSAKQKHDLERMAILEDKFQEAEILAKMARNEISKFKRVK